MAAEPLTIHGAAGAYAVVIQAGALNDALPAFVAEHGFSRVAVITNTTLAPLYGEALAARLPGGFLVTVPDGEQYKNLDTVQNMYAQLLASGADRATLIVALGGGVIGDVAGFAAATFMRGVSLVQAPTSLLAMVDSSIGGKVGVDLPQGKNLAGAFKDPLAVFADTSTLATLPDIEFRCGLAEIVKAALIADPPLLAHLLQYGPQPVKEIITRAVTVKKLMVEQDRLEKGVRAYLNLGHTFAHALEQVSGYTWKHGEAVGVGLVAAVRLSVGRGLCMPDTATAVERAVSDLGLPVRFSDLDSAALWDAMHHDKKWQNGLARFVLLERLGQPVIVSDVRRDEVIPILEGLRQ
jgi:shikimate kinase/3-dehydroquinate synthase